MPPAEARAREAGKSVSDYLANLLMVPREKSALHLLAVGSRNLSDLSSEEQHSDFTRYLLEIARDIRDRHEIDNWTSSWRDLRRGMHRRFPPARR